MYFRKLWRSLFSLFLVALCFNPARTEPAGGPALPRSDEIYHYVCRDQDVNEAVRFFALNLGIGADIAPGIQGRTTEKTPRDLASEAYLDHLAAEFRFVWYFDGAILHVAPSSSVQTEIIALKQARTSRVISALSRLGLLQPKFDCSYDLKSRAIRVSGPPAYVSQIKTAVKALDDAAPTDLHVLRGKREPVAPPLPVEMPPQGES